MRVDDPVGRKGVDGASTHTHTEKDTHTHNGLPEALDERAERGGVRRDLRQPLQERLISALCVCGV